MSASSSGNDLNDGLPEIRAVLGTRPIIVTGEPRTGTSMMMRMLEAGGVPCVHDAARRPADASNPHGYYEGGEGHPDGAAKKIILIDDAQLDVTRTYDVIRMARDPIETILSQRLFSIVRGSTTCPADCLERVLASRPHRAEIAQMERAIQRRTAWLAAQPNLRLLTMDYGALVGMRYAEIIATHLGLPLDVKAMRDVIDPALYRVRLAR